MGLFTGIGDFFRGAFGEDDNEKKRRKQREAQQAQQRQQQAAAQAKIQKQSVQTVNDLFGAKPNQPKAAPTVVKPTQLQQNKKPPVPAPTVPKPQPAPPTTVDFKKLNATPAVPDRQFPKGKAPDAGSAQDIKNKFVDTLAASTARVATGIPQGASGLVDLVTPGKGTSRVSKALTQQAEDIDKFAKKQNIETGYKVGNVIGEVGSYIIPSTAASKIASAFPRGVKLTDAVIDRAARLVDDAGEAGKVRKFLADRMRRGYGLDEAIEDSAISARYIGQNAAEGNKTSGKSVATDVALGLGGGLVFPGRVKKMFKPGDTADEATGAAVAAVTEGGRIIDNTKAGEASQAAQKAIEEKGLQNAAEKDLEELANDSAGTALDRKKARDELNRRKAAADAAANQPNPADRPAYAIKEDISNIIKQQEDNLNDYINKNPGLTKAQLEAAREAAAKRANKLIEELKASREAAIKAVDDQGQATTKTVEAGQKAVEDAQTASAAKTAPAPKDIVQAAPTTANPEVSANNAYTPPAKREYADYSTGVVDDIGEGGKKVKRGNIAYNNPITKNYNKAQQWWIEKVDAGGDKITDQTQKAIQSGNRFNKGTAELPRLFFKNFGQKKEAVAAMIKRTSQLQNSGRVAVTALKKMEQAAKRAGDPAQVYERIYRVLETPEYLARRYGDDTKLTVNDLTPEERVAFDMLVKLNKRRNDINYDTGLINADQHAQYANGLHSPRIYDINVQYPQLKNTKGLDLRAAKKRNELKDVPDYIFDESIASPFQASALRLESALKNKAHMETLQNLDAINGLPTSAPNENFVPLRGKKYGEYEGRYIDKQLLSQLDGKDYYNSSVGQAAGDLINTFHNSILGAPGRAYKKFRTTLSPGTIVGNIGSGQFAFSKAVNINPLTSMFRTAQAAKQLKNANKGINPQVQEAELAGLFAGDTGRLINNTKQPERAVGRKDNLWDKAGNFYGGIDRATALGWFNELRARGLTPEQAVARVHLGMQNYANSGRLVNAAADSPIFGKPFARFTPELLRIAKNAAVYNPVGTFGSAAAGAYGLNELSKRSGETPEERKAREEAPGQTKIGNLSLNVPIPKGVPGIGDSSINIARAIGLNFPQEPNSDPNSAILRQINPFADPTRTNAQGEQVFAPNQLVGDMFYRQIADQVVDRDFMGRQITDPDNKTYYEDGKASIKKFPDDLSDSEKLKNRARSASMGLPFAPELDNIINAVKGNEDYYGKERTLPQAIGRMFGVKIENNDQATRDKRTASNRFFDEDLPAVQKFVQENPDLAQKYFQIKNPTRTRPRGKDDQGTKISDLITPEKWDIINSDTSGRLFGFMKSQEERLHQRSVEENSKDPNKKIKPIDPIFQLPPDQAKYVAELRSRPSGDDIEAQDILRATSDWYKNYEDKYHAYLTENSKYYDSQPKFKGAKDNPRVKEYDDSSVPIEQPEIIKEYYKIKAADPEKAKEVYKANKDVLSKAFDSYAKARLDRINKLRKIEGYDPISIDTYKNKTFGFDVEDGSNSYGRYSRRGGSGGSRTPDVNDLGDITNFTKGVNGLDPIEAQAMPQLAQLFNTLNAGSGGGRAKPKIGASGTGR